jgi:hypothetical protein
MRREKYYVLYIPAGLVAKLGDASQAGAFVIDGGSGYYCSQILLKKLRID